MFPSPSTEEPELSPGEDGEREPDRAPPEFADGRPRRLDPRYVPCARVSGWIGTAVLFLLGPLGLLVTRWGEPWGQSQALLIACGWAALVAVSALLASLFPGIKYRHLSWRLSPAGFEIRRGVVFRHLISVPLTRVQHIDVQRGPLERRFGLASLSIHTAGHQDSEITLEGLPVDTALALRDHLLRTGVGDGS